MTQGQYAVILVHSTSHAVRVEKLLQAGGIPSKMIPVPRHISSDCGACLRILRADIEAARRAIQAGSVEIESIRGI